MLVRAWVRPLAALLFTTTALAGLAGCSQPTPTTGPTSGAGYQAGDGSFTLWKPDERGAAVTVAGQDLAGQGVDSSQWSGEVTVVNFWYASCPPCRAEAPDLVDLAAKYPQVHFVGVNPRDDKAAAAAFEESFAVTYPTILDPDARIVGSFQGVVPLQAMPTTVVLDGQGRPAARILGRIDPSILAGLIDDALAEVGGSASPAAPSTESTP